MKLNKKLNKNNKYMPKIKFSGKYECYFKIENVETKLSEWILVYNELQKQK